MGAFDQRPRFYEGQFLSAADLAAVTEYQRTAQARHGVGAHTWGIALGLTLRERTAPGEANRVEVILDPGLAWDGFGRAIVVDRPTRIREETFADVAFAASADAPPAPQQPKGRLVKLWIAYDEIPAKPPAPGFQACTDDDQSARIRETFRIEGGDPAMLRPPLTIGVQSVDAEQALSAFDTTAPTLWDTSVPHQTFPAERDPPQWLVPLGYARWIARDGALGYFARIDLDPADKAADRTRALRRYVGVVAQNLEGADGAVVLRARGDLPLKPGSLLNRLSNGDAWTDLRQDMTWIEGNARVVGDAKLAGGALRFRNVDGKDEGTALDVTRANDGTPPGNRELRVVLGGTGQIDTRLVAGPLDAAQAIQPRFVVTSGAGPTKLAAEGRVGVNTRDPLAALHVNGDWDGKEDGALRLSGAKPTLRFTGGADEDGQSWMAQVGDKGLGLFRIAHEVAAGDWRTVVAATKAHQVGIGTELPAGTFTVEDQPNHKLSIFTPNSDIEYAGGATNQFTIRQVPAGVTSFLDMKIGVGIPVPAYQFHVKGDRIRLESADGLRIVDLRADGSSVDLQSETSHVYIRSTTPPAQGAPVRHVVMNPSPEDGRVGVGRIPTTEKLEVQGNVRLGLLANMFAMGANRPIRAVIGEVAANGSFPPNLEYVATNTGTGNYRIDFAPPFSGKPVVLVSPVDTSNDDNLMTVVSVTAASFVVRSRDVVDMNAQSTNTPAPQNDGFSFVAFGPA